VHEENRILGSNPTLSAKRFQQLTSLWTDGSNLTASIRAFFVATQYWSVGNWVQYRSLIADFLWTSVSAIAVPLG
jgi:hypothetical protein